jgi:RNA polymerase sigma factor (sigma-70 family)
MSTFDRREPPRSFTTDGGVTVIVQPPPAPEPKRAPDPWDHRPAVVIVPPPRPERDREAFLRSLCAQHGDFIRRTLLRRGDITAESTKDIQQRVLLVVDAHVQEHGEPENIRGFLTGVIRNEVRRHKRRWRPDVDPGADAEAAFETTPSPETQARRGEQREKLARYLACLAPEEAEVVQAIDILGLTVDATAELLGRPRGTVSTQLTRARQKLLDLAAASERAAGPKPAR